MNAHSSRSHSIFSIKVHQKDASSKTNVFAKINLVDLAGSERVAKSGATGKQLTEGVNINKSLSALGNVINALAETAKTGKAIFVPFRNSKLTRVLQESLGGNSLTSMLATVSPALSNIDETFSTLKYADRAKAIRLKAVKNEEIGQIEKLEREIASLRERLAENRNGSQPVDIAGEKRLRKQIAEYESFMKQTWEDKEAMSIEHERERERIIVNNRQQQQALARKVADEQQRRWNLLTEKDDVLLTIRDLALDQLEELMMHAWVSPVEEAARLEEDADTQFKVVQLHQSDFEACVEHWAGQATDQDKTAHPALTAALSTQLKGKLAMLVAEAQTAQRAQKAALQACDGAEKAVAVAMQQIQMECGGDAQEDGSSPSTPKSARSLVLKTVEEQQDGLALVQRQLGARAFRMRQRYLGSPAMGAPASIPVDIATATTIMAAAGRVGESPGRRGEMDGLINDLQRAMRRLQHTQCFIAPGGAQGGGPQQAGSGGGGGNPSAAAATAGLGHNERASSRGKARPGSRGKSRPGSGAKQRGGDEQEPEPPPRPPQQAVPISLSRGEGVVRSGMELASAVMSVLSMCSDLSSEAVRRRQEQDSSTLSRTEERVRKLKQENEKLRADLLSASTALQSASTTINNQSGKLQELKKVHKRVLREQEGTLEQQRVEGEAHMTVVRELSAKLEMADSQRRIDQAGGSFRETAEAAELRHSLSAMALERDTVLCEVGSRQQDHLVTIYGHITLDSTPFCPLSRSAPSNKTTPCPYMVITA